MKSNSFFLFLNSFYNFSFSFIKLLYLDYKSYNWLFNVKLSYSNLCSFSFNAYIYASLSLNYVAYLSKSDCNYEILFYKSVILDSFPDWRLPRLLNCPSNLAYLFFQSFKSLSLFYNVLVKSLILDSYYDFIVLN